MMKATLQSTTDAILVTDNQFRVTDFNDKYTAMWAIPAGVMAAQDHSAVLDHTEKQVADPEAFRVRVRCISTEGHATTFDALTLLDGRIIERRSNPQVVDGLAVGRVWSFTDVTQARRVEEALRDETRMLEWLNQLGRNLTSQLDLPAVVHAVTAAATEISGAQFGLFIPNPAAADKDTTPLSSTASGETPESSALSDAVRAALADGRLAWQLPLRSDDLQADEHTRRMFTSPGLDSHRWVARSLMFIPVTSPPGLVLGALVFAHDAPGVFTHRTKRILGGVAAQAAVAIANARLYTRVRLEFNDHKLSARLQKDYLDGLRGLSRRLLDAGEQERKRLGRELHDQVGANLSALTLGLELIRNELPQEASSLLAKRLADFEATLHQTMQHVRDVLGDLRPIALDELGLLSALRHQASVLNGRTHVEFLIHGSEPSPRLLPECEIAFYRIAQEAWTNVLKHANARQVRLTLEQRDGRVSMRVEDDGKGFDPAARPPGLPSLGLVTMRERADAIGALLELETSPGTGVRLTLSVATDAPGRGAA
jgi:signal transduction histidine kinase